MNLTTNDARSSILEELRIIPRIAWGVVGLVLLFWFAVALPLLVGTVPANTHRFAGGPERLVLIPILIFAGTILGVWLMLVFYVNADAGRRHMSRLVWTLLVIFVPYGIGFIVYYVARQPIHQPCPNCGAILNPDFLFCPRCRHELKPRCPGCQRNVETGWVNCAFCGAKLS